MDRAAGIGLDQAAGLRQIFAQRRPRMLPLASVLGRAEHELLVARLRAGLRQYDCTVHELDDPSAYFFDREFEIALALADDTQSVTAAYTLVKAAARRHGRSRFRLLFAGTAPAFEPHPIVARMARVARRFLNVEVKLGAVLSREPYPDALSDLAAAAAGWRLPEFPHPVYPLPV